MRYTILLLITILLISCDLSNNSPQIPKEMQHVIYQVTSKTCFNKPTYAFKTNSFVYGPKLNYNFFVQINNDSLHIINSQSCQIDTTLLPSNSIDLAGLELNPIKNKLLYFYRWIFYESDSATTVVIAENNMICGIVTHLVKLNDPDTKTIEVNYLLGEDLFYKIKPGYNCQSKIIHYKNFVPSKYLLK